MKLLCHACSALSILGVDFQAFPRRFAKCETFGVSLMDAGVGAFIFAAGLVSRRARGAQSQSRASITIGGLTKPVAMICVGLIKYAVHSSIEYQVRGFSGSLSSILYSFAIIHAQNHVSEYGLHWNFFFTFGIVTMVSALRPVRINECFTLAGRPVPVTALTDLVLGVALAVGVCTVWSSLFSSSLQSCLCVQGTTSPSRRLASKISC